MSDRYAGLRLEWSNWVEQWESSGLSAAEFCRRHDLPVLRFYSWRRRFRLWDQSAAGNDANAGGSFVPLAFREEHSPCGIAVVFSSGVRLVENPELVEHRFQSKLDSDSGGCCTLIPRQVGQFSLPIGMGVQDR